MKGTTANKFCRILVELLIVACLLAYLVAPGTQAKHTPDIQDRCQSRMLDDVPALADRPKDLTGG